MMEKPQTITDAILSRVGNIQTFDIYLLTSEEKQDRIQQVCGLKKKFQINCSHNN